MRKKCVICKEHVANYIDTYEGISILVCKRCLQINRIERNFNQALLSIVPHLKRKRYSQAKKILSTSLKKLSKDQPLYIRHWLEREYMEWLAHFCYMTQDYRTAIKLLCKRSSRKYNSNYSKLTDNLMLSAAYYESGEKEKAKKTLESMLKFGIRTQEPSALTALLKLQEYYGETLEPKNMYTQAIKELCFQRNIRVNRKCMNIHNNVTLSKCIEWLSLIKERWY